MRDTPARAALREMGVLQEAHGRAWLELSTSGTTAAARTVHRSLASWEASFDHVSRLTGTVATDRVLVPAPPSGSMFAFARAHLAHVGAEAVNLPRWSLRDAESALATCTLAHLTPAMLAGLLARDLGRLRTVVCAGAALPEAVRRRAEAAGVHVVDYYGAAELSFVAMRVEGRLDPFPEVEVGVRDGVVWARSPWLADGYAPGQWGPLVRDADGWATVGDRGRLDDDLGLVVLGRGDDAVTTGGATVLCADVEAAVLALPGISAAVAVGSPHAELGELLEVVVLGARPLDLDELRSRTAELVTRTHVPRRWHVWTELPLTAAGKVDRAEVRSRLAAERAMEPTA
ncbi:MULTISPECIES: class I adenylate-forming enzyme family protein [unclassified Knoellia]|uniref:class I adenylate-forming enzyme family protein n=1 Tax=Knoellia altitudinis TaxID=3404795 RepID=UPI0036244A1D